MHQTPDSSDLPHDPFDVAYPNAVAPERERSLVSSGVRLHISEWGDPERPPVLLTHGMWDHGRGFDTLAPLLAEHYRVRAGDGRGHGESGWAAAYNWSSEIQDVVRVLGSLGRPVRLVGHSKGGAQAMEAALAAPETIEKVVNIDGFGPPGEDFQPPGAPVRSGTRAEQFAQFLDRRHRLADRDAWKPYAHLDDLVERRQRMNPRLSVEWLRYFAFHGARYSDEGWRWKSDPTMGNHFGPHRSAWIAPAWQGLEPPVLAVVGSEEDTWGPLPEDLLAERLAWVPRLERATVEGAGHFVHMERPVETAKVLIDFLA